MPIIVPSSDLPGPTLSELRDELRARGRDSVADARLDYFINAGISWLCDQERWPFLEVERAGTAPLFIDGLLAVGLVLNSTGVKVDYVPRRSLREQARDLTQEGVGTCWYFTVDRQVATWPLDVEITVECWLRPNRLDGDSERSIVPGAYRHVLVDAADREAAKDSREWDAVQALRGDLEGYVAVMRDSLLEQQHDIEDFIQTNGEYA